MAYTLKDVLPSSDIPRTLEDLLAEPELSMGGEQAREAILGPDPVKKVARDTQEDQNKTPIQARNDRKQREADAVAVQERTAAADQEYREAVAAENLGWRENFKRNVENFPQRAKAWVGGLGQSLEESAVSMTAQVAGNLMTGKGMDIGTLSLQSVGFGRNTDIEKVTDAYLNEKRERGDILGQQTFEEARAAIDKNAPNYGDTKMQFYLMEGGNALAELAAATGVSIIAKTPTAGAALMGGRVFGDTYGNARESGRTAGEAMQDASFSAFAEFIPERIALGAILKPGGTIGRRIATGAAAEGLQEMVTETLQIGYDAGVLKEDMTFGEAKDRLIDAGIIGAIAGGGVGAMTSRGIEPQTPEEQAAATRDIERGVIDSFDPNSGSAPRPSSFLQREIPDPRQNVELSEGDRASPISDELIQAGKNTVADALGDNRPLKPVAAAPAPPVAQPFDRMVQITLGSESNNRDFNNQGGVLTSAAGAKGKMQVLDGTNTDPGFGVRPAQNNSLAERARVGRDYLAAMLKRYGGDPAKMWAAYNWGPGALDAAIAEHGDAWLDNAPAETRAYVMKNLGELGGAAFNQTTGELGTIEVPETVETESAEDFASRVLGSDWMDAKSASSVAATPEIDKVMESVNAVQGTVENAVSAADIVPPEPVAPVPPVAPVAPVEPIAPVAPVTPPAPVATAPAPSIEQPTAAPVEPIESDIPVEPAAPPAPNYRIETTASGKGITVYDLNPGQLEAIQTALPKISAIPKSDGGYTFSKKHEAKIKDVLDGFTPITIDPKLTPNETAALNFALNEGGVDPSSDEGRQMAAILESGEAVTAFEEDTLLNALRLQDGSKKPANKELKPDDGAEVLGGQTFGNGNSVSVNQSKSGASIDYQINGFAGGSLATGKDIPTAVRAAVLKLQGIANGKGAQSAANREAAEKMLDYLGENFPAPNAGQITVEPGQEAKIEAAKKAANRPAAPVSGRKEIGKNADGLTIEEDENGVRSYVKKGVRLTETVGLVPGGGISIEVDRRSDDYLTDSERDAKKPAKSGKPKLTAKEQAELDQLDADNQNGDIGDDEDVVRRLDLKAKANPKPDFAGAVNKDLSKDQVDAVAAIFDNAEKRATPDKPKSNYGAANRIVTQDRAEELRKKIKERLKGARLNSGFDPELMAAGMELSAFHIEAGARKFGQYAKAIADDLGMTMAELKPYLRAWYNGARDFLEDSGQDVADMDGPGAVRAGLQFIEDTQSAETVAETTTVGSPLVSAFVDAFGKGQQFKSITEARTFAKEQTGQEFKAGTAEAKTLEEAIEFATVLVARDIVARGNSPQATFDALVALYAAQPKLATRTSTSVSQQAFSTPAPLAYIASQLAGITNQTTVYEPSAGNGMLLIGAATGNATVNELNPDRAAQLRQLFDNVTTNDAADYKPNGQFDAVIANPPFGSIKDPNGDAIRFQVDRQYSTNEIDHAIAMKALETLEDGGRAVLIVGGINKLITDPKKRADAYNGKAKREFYFKLYSGYNVVDHFTVDGSLYERQGAGWPVDVIVIEGRGQSSRTLPAIKAPPQFNSWDALAEKLNNEQRPNQKAEPVGDTDGSNSVQGERPTTANVRDTGERGDSRPDRRERIDTNGDSEPVRDGPVDGQSSGARVDGDRAGGVEPARNQGPDRPNQRDTIDETAENERQSVYVPGSGAKTMGTLVPVNMADSIADALDLLEQRVGNIDAFVTDRLNYKSGELAKYFGAEQIDAIALAIDNIERGAGFIIGDQTGIGKGRVNAAMIRYAIIQKRNPIFVTEKPNLYGDMFRDLTDIGIQEMLGRELNIVMTDAGASVLIDEATGEKLKTPASEKHNKFLKSIAGKKLADVGVDAIFTTYSQMQTVKSKETVRRDTLKSLAVGGVLMLDESHNAGGQAGAAPVKGAAPNRADFVRGLVTSAHGVFYSSATYAKRPDVMDLYSATDMRLAVPDLKDLGEAISKGGVPMQQVVASMLARAGQYVRRERSFEGIAYNTPIVPISRELYSDACSILTMIQNFTELNVKGVVADMDEKLRAEAKSVSADGATGNAGAESTNFTSIMHNIIDQMLLAFTADAAAQKAIDALKAGEKPVITVSNTLGSFLKQYADDSSVSVGEQMDITFADVFSRYLERARWVKVKKPFAEKGDEAESIRLTDAQIGSEGVAAFNAAMDFINKSNLDSLPGSPLDHMIAKVQQAGYTVGEITGRSIGLDYRDGKAFLKTRPAADLSIAGRQSTIAGYNSGKIDVILLNRSGATGLSLHASEKFKDQRKRRMIIAQAEANIDTHMQMLGRVHRTGQVVLPEYDQLVGDVPAQKRPAAVLAKKMASLNANTTASRDSALTSSETLDFMNEYGDEVVAQIMEEEPDIHKALGEPLKTENDDGYVRDGAARKVTGRIPLLKMDEQEEIYQRIEDEYRTLLAQKEAAGENALEAKTFPLDAETIATAEALPPIPGASSPFAGAVIVETVDVKRLGKPYSSEEVRDRVEGSLQAQLSDIPSVSGMTIPQMLAATREAQNTRLRNEMAEGQQYMREQVEGATKSETAKTTRDRLTDNATMFRAIRNLTQIGAGVKVRTPNGNFYGIVTDMDRTGNAKNPLALGSWKLTVAVVDSARTMTFPLSQIGINDDGKSLGRVFIERTDKIGDIPIVEAFDSMQNESREMRMVVTGNMLAGFDYVNGNGSIINYTTKTGEVRQGIMMRRDFNLEKHIAGKPVPLTSAPAVVEWLRTEGGPITGQGSTGAVSLFAVRDSFAITTAKTKKAGGEFFLNTRLTRALGTEFVSKSTGMVAETSIDRATDAVQVLMDSGVRFAVDARADQEVKDRARALAEKHGSRFSRSATSQPVSAKGMPSPAKWDAIKERIRAQIDPLNLGDSIVIKAVNRIFDNPLVEGRYFDRVIEVALNTKTGKTIEFVINHEAIHAMRDLGLFKPAEWTSLSKAAEANKPLMENIRRRYPELSRMEQVEEAIADLYAGWRKTNTIQGGFLRSAFQRLDKFLKAIRDAITGSGLTAEAEAIFQQITAGDIGARRETTPDISPRNERMRIAFHGTKHEFDIFSTDYIGSGEGAQVFGWGLYFAEQKDVAEFYRRSIAGYDNFTIKASYQGKDSDAWLTEAFTDKGVNAKAADTAQAAVALEDELQRNSHRDYEDQGENFALTRAQIDQAIEKVMERSGNTAEVTAELKKMVGKATATGVRKRFGRVYQVNIPEDHEYLQWDTPISTQSQSIRDAVQKIEDHLVSVGAMDEIAERMNLDSLQELNGAELIAGALRIAANNDALPFEGELGAQIQEPIEWSGHYQKSISIWLNALGIPGTRYLDRGSRSVAQGTYNYVIFDDSRISVEGKFSLGETAGKLIGNRQKVADRLDVWRTNLQNRMLPLLRSQQKVEMETGEVAPESMNPYLKEELMTGKVGARLEKLTDELVNPLIEGIEAEGLDIDQVETYLYARHAPERNARISGMNAEFAEGTGSGMSDAEAAAIMAQAEMEGKTPALERLADKVDAILQFAMDTRVESGLLSQEEADTWRSNYQYYVPLRGRAELEPELEGAVHGRPSGITVRGKESKRAFGRESKAVNILAYTITQAEEAIVRAGKNEVAQAFYNLAKASPDKEFWRINKVTRKPFFNAATGTVSYRNQTQIQPEDEPYTVVAKFEGQERRVTMNRDNPKAVRLAEAMRNLNGTEMTGVMEMLSNVNRFLSFVNTGLNPEFVITNAFRDLQTAGINLAGFDEKGLIKGTLKDYLPALKGSIRGAFKKDKGEWGKWYQEFVNEGGRVYFNRVDDLNEIQKRIEKQLTNKVGGIGAVKSGLFATKEFIQNANTGVENAVRLSAYKNAREAGMTKAQAASLAKNLTVNFNRRGAWGVGMNSLYLFYNASIQGSARLLLAMRHKRVQKVLAGAVIMGFALDALNMMLSDDDDDGQSYYDKISDYDKSRNLIVMIPDGDGKHIKIPLPYGYNSFFAMGRTASEIYSGKRWQDSMSSLLMTIVDSFNPIGGSDNIGNLLSPTIGDPVVDLIRNRDFADRPIMPEQNQFGPEEPDNQRYWGSISPHWRVMTQELNKISGGDDVVPGYIDISPETLEHLSGYVTGAAGTFWIDRVGGLGEKVLAGEEITSNDIPFTRKVIGNKPTWYDKAAYYARVDGIKQFKHNAKEYRERGNEEAAIMYEDRSPDIYDMIPEADRASSALTKLRKERAKSQLAYDIGDIDEAEYRQIQDDLKIEETDIIEDFNALYIATVEKPVKP